MKRVLLAVLLSAPLAAMAAEGGGDPFTHGDAKAGEAKAAACAACHGPGGVSANPAWPKLAGQGSAYIAKQLHSFKDGSRKNPLMSAQAAMLSDEDMANLAAYFASQPFNPGVASEAAVAKAEKLFRGGDADKGIPACAACHGPDGAGIAAAAYPRLGGQHATYVASRLKAYRAMTPGEDADGNLKTMAAVAAKLSDDQIEALASYVNGLQ